MCCVCSPYRAAAIVGVSGEYLVITYYYMATSQYVYFIQYKGMMISEGCAGMSCGASCCCFLPCSPMARGGGGPCLADGPAAHCLYMLRVCRLCIWCWRRLGTLFFVLPRRQRQALNRVFYFTLRMHTHTRAYVAVSVACECVCTVCLCMCAQSIWGPFSFIPLAGV